MPYRSPDRRAITPQGRGRYPGFDVLAQVDRWDDVTAGAVLSRLSHPTGLSFFTVAEVAVAAPLLELLLAQDGEPRVPVLELIDERPAVGEADGRAHDATPRGGTTTGCGGTARRGGRRWPAWTRMRTAGSGAGSASWLPTPRRRSCRPC